MRLGNVHLLIYLWVGVLANLDGKIRWDVGQDNG